MKVKSESEVTQSCLTLSDPMDCSRDSLGKSTGVGCHCLLRHIHNGILLTIKRNTYESVLMRWMNLGPIIHSEISQKEKKNTVY